MACEYCGKEANLKCGSCAKVVYCDKTCQTTHWSQHKKACVEYKTDKIIARAADTLQKAGYLFRERALPQNITKIQEHGGYLNVTNERDKKAILTIDVCQYTTGFLHDFLKQLFKGISAEIYEVSFRMKRPNRTAMWVKPDGTPMVPGVENAWHDILHISSAKTTKMWAVDVAGAQYDLFESCKDWESYRNEHTRSVTRINPLGGAKEYCERMGRVGACPGQVYSVTSEIAKCFHVAVHNWEKKGGLTVQQLMRLPDDEEFSVRQTQLLQYVQDDIDRFLHDANFSKYGRAAFLFLLANPGVCEDNMRRLDKEMIERTLDISTFKWAS